ncbi:hypothetical protein ACHAP5_003171 [Fusarium lateritium]
MKVCVVGDKGTRGTVHLPLPLLVPIEKSAIKVNGKVANGTSFSVDGGDEIVINQVRRT